MENDDSMANSLQRYESDLICNVPTRHLHAHIQVDVLVRLAEVSKDAPSSTRPSRGLLGQHGGFGSSVFVILSVCFAYKRAHQAAR